MVKLDEPPAEESGDLDGIQGRKLIHLPDADELKYALIHPNSKPSIRNTHFSGEH